MLRLVPKGRKERCSYFIDEDTKRHLMEVIRFLGGKNGDRLIPIVKTESGKRRRRTVTFCSGIAGDSP